MTCKEIEKQIPLFLNDSLDGDDLAEFVNHIKQCRDCEEELTIQYLSIEGLARLEEGASFSLDDELKSKVNRADRRVKLHGRIEKICRNIEAVAIVILGAAIVYMVW
ncbi:MAG: zf-HC2 domain-containing protein [Lachnospiraceae bacterium]|nr:zf-HC2 domain-containing protein [Lachnospiraceae bacterium]